MQITHVAAQKKANYPFLPRVTAIGLGKKLVAATLLLSPAVAFAAADAAGTADRRLLSDRHAHADPFNKIVQDDLHPARHLLSVQQMPPVGYYDTYLVPRNAFGDDSTGFKVLDGKALGTQATLADPGNSNTELFTVSVYGGKIQLNGPLNGISACLAIAGGNYADKTSVELQPCNEGNTQNWNFVAVNPGTDGVLYYRIEALGAPEGINYCLDVTASGTTVGTNVELYHCNGGSNQEWTLVNGG